MKFFVVVQEMKYYHNLIAFIEKTTCFLTFIKKVGQIIQCLCMKISKTDFPTHLTRS